MKKFDHRSTSATPSLAIRAGALALLALAPLMPAVHREATTRSVVFVVDRSTSVAGEGARTARAFLNEVEATRDDARVGVVAFDGRPFVARPVVSLSPSTPEEGERLGDTTATAEARGGAIPGTDIAAALQLARAAMPDEGERRIVLLSDGRGTRGDALAEARRAQQAGVVVDTIPIGAARQDLFISRFAPREDRVADGQPASIALELSGAPRQRVAIEWTRDGRSFGRDSAVLDADGKGSATLRDSTPGPGVHVYGARLLEGASATSPGARAEAAIDVTGKPRALVIALDSQCPGVLAKALDDAGIERVQTILGESEVDAAALSGADVVVLADVPLAAAGSQSSAGGLTREAQEALVDFAQRGGGVIVTGGPFGFAPEYDGTPLARMLPVEIESQGQVEDPRVAMAIMLDRSGSMGARVGTHTKIQLATEASLAAASTLRPDDILALGSVDTKTTWNHPLGPISLLEGRREAIRSIDAGGGGIYVYTALVDAYAALAHANAPVRHVILFADTADAEQQTEDCSGAGCTGGPHTAGDIAETARRAGITTSVVGIGREQDSDTAFLRKLATSGGGRFYITGNGTDLRRIFVSETRVATRSNLRDGPVAVSTREDHPILSGVDVSTFPPLGGYVETKRRPTADTAIETRDDPRPILASWRYGLGKVVALTTDLRADWKSGWSTAPAAGQVLRQAVRFALRKRGTTAADVRVAVNDGRANVSVDLADDPGGGGPDVAPTLEAFAFDGSGRPEPVNASLDRIAPGRYAASFRTRGRPFVVARVRDGAGAMLGEGIGEAASSLELAALGPDERALRDIASEGGGAYDPSPAEAMRRGGPRGREPLPTWPWALLVAASLVAVDLWSRRIAPRRALASPTRFDALPRAPAPDARREAA